MISIIKCYIAVLVLLLLFYFWGNAINSSLKLNRTYWAEKIFVGFFVYFSVFQFYVIYMICSFKPFTRMCEGWILIVIAVTLMCCLVKNRIDINIDLKKLNNKKSDLIVIMLFLLALFCVVINIQPYAGWDTVHYVGEMNEAIYTDTMYQFNADNGSALNSLGFKDVLNSGFFMQFAFISKLLGISPLTCAFYLMRSLGYCLFVCVMYLFGMELFKKDSFKAIYLVCTAVLMNFCFSTYLSTEFFNLRLYEGKGFCQNVIIPFTIYCLVKIYKDYASTNNMDGSIFKMLFLVGLASVPISMSSILIFPFMVEISCFAIWTAYPKKPFIIINGFICTIPNIVYFLIYYLWKSDYLNFYIS